MKAVLVDALLLEGCVVGHSVKSHEAVDLTTKTLQDGMGGTRVPLVSGPLLQQVFLFKIDAVLQFQYI